MTILIVGVSMLASGAWVVLSPVADVEVLPSGSEEAEETGVPHGSEDTACRAQTYQSVLDWQQSTAKKSISAFRHTIESLPISTCESGRTEPSTSLGKAMKRFTLGTKRP
jgi:hypothetical protein